MTEDTMVEHQESELETGEGTPKISLYAISRVPSPHTMRLVGSLSGHQVVILANLESTHNFLHTTVAKRVRIPIDSSKGLRVGIANGELLQSEGYCMQLTTRVQGTHISSSFYVLQLGGCDMVLGISCLSTLGSIM